MCSVYAIEENATSKLINLQVEQIDKLKGIIHPALVAHECDISESRIKDIWAGRGWNHITGRPPFEATKIYKPQRSKEQIAIDDANKRPNHIGMNNAQAKLNDDIVQEIRRLKGYLTLQEIGDKFGVSVSSVSSIHNWRAWNHVPVDPSIIPPPPRLTSRLAKLSPDSVREIRKLRGTMKQKDIAAKYGISPQALSDLFAGRSYQDII